MQEPRNKAKELAERDLVERPPDAVPQTYETYRNEWIITTYRKKGRIVAEGYRLSDGIWVELVLGRGWEKRTFPLMGADEELVFWDEFAAYKAQWIKRKAERSELKR